MKKHYALVPGLHSEDFTKAVMREMMRIDEAWGPSCCNKTDILVGTTGNGDIIVQSSDINCDAAFLFQEMGDDPWTDLAALCTAAEFLKQQGAKYVTAITPLWKLGHHAGRISYSRDKIGTQKFIADILRDSAIDRLVTLTPTVDMLTAMYPVRVMQPNLVADLARVLGPEAGYSSVILAVEDAILPLARELASRTMGGYGLLQIGKYNSFSSARVEGRDILLYAQQYTCFLYKAVADLRGQHCRSVSCFVPWIANPQDLEKDIGLDRLITLESGHEPYAQMLPVSEILAKWIMSDMSKGVQ